MCGKSAQAILVITLQDKPHLEQDKAWNWPFVAYSFRVCRTDKWLPLYQKYRTESGLLFTLLNQNLER